MSDELCFVLLLRALSSSAPALLLLPFCLLPFAFCLLPFAFLPSAFCYPYGIVLQPRRGSIIGNAAVLKTAARKGLQVRVLSPPPAFQTRFFRTKTARHILV